MLRFWAITVLAMALAAAPTPSAPFTIHLIGDSTMADKPDPEHNPERGWGQALPAFVNDGAVVKNYAVNGRSTKSFIDQGRWSTVREALKPGDYLFIQFGHNDEKRDDSTRYAAPRGAYRANLERFVREARERGATPVLFTSIVRRHFTASSVLEDTHGEYPVVTREIAREMGVLLVDHEQLTRALVERAGPDSSTALYVYTSEGQFPAFPAARRDDTHLSPRGAREVARLAARALRALDRTLAEALRD